MMGVLTVLITMLVCMVKMSRELEDINDSMSSIARTLHNLRRDASQIETRSRIEVKLMKRQGRAAELIEPSDFIEGSDDDYDLAPIAISFGKDQTSKLNRPTVARDRVHLHFRIIDIPLLRRTWTLQRPRVTLSRRRVKMTL